MTTFYNVIDEKGRYCGLKIDPKGRSGQTETHTFSYIYAREIEKELCDGNPIGLEAVIHHNG